jgi:hypothetical protein
MQVEKNFGWELVAEHVNDARERHTPYGPRSNIDPIKNGCDELFFEVFRTFIRQVYSSTPHELGKTEKV